MEHDGKTPHLTRRAFLRAAMTGASAALLAACGSTTAETPPPAAATDAPVAAAPTSAPAATAAEAATAAPAATAAEAATSAPAATAAATAAAAPATAVPLELPQGAAGKFTVIHRTEYFDLPQQLFRDTMTEYAKSQNAPLDISTANPEAFGDFLAKMRAAVQAGNPPDLAYHTLSIPQMHSLDIVEDVTDVVDELVSKYGAVVPKLAEKSAKFDGKWYAVPFMSYAGGWFARKDVFSAAGVDVNTLTDLDSYRDAALKASDPSKEMWAWGTTVNKGGDGHSFIMLAILNYGGAIVDKTGTKVVFNSPETLAGVKWMAEIFTSDKYKPMLPPGILSWTDASNNETFLAGKTALTANAFSIYAKAKKDNNPIFPNIAVLRVPKAQNGNRLEAGSNGWLTIFKGSQNIDLAKGAIKNIIAPEQFDPIVKGAGGLLMPAYANLWTDEILALDPNFATIKEIVFNDTDYTGFSYPADPSAVVDAVFAQAIPSQMMANIVNGSMTPEQAVEDTHNKIVQLFEDSGIPQ